MLTTIGMIVLNEADLIAANLSNHYSMADKIIVVEGADRRFPNATEDGLSTDDTAEIVQSFPDPDRKITFIQHGWADDKSDLRNRYCGLAEDGILIAVDADEFLSPRSAEGLIKELEKLPGPGCVRIHHIHLWKTLDQSITGGYYSVPHNRAYRWIKGCRHPHGEHNHPSTPDGKLLFKHRTKVITPGPYWLHLGFCKPPDQIEAKNVFYVNRGEATSRPGTTKDRAAWFDESTPEGCTLHSYSGWIPKGLPSVYQSSAGLLGSHS